MQCWTRAHVEGFQWSKEIDQTGRLRIVAELHREHVANVSLGERASSYFVPWSGGVGVHLREANPGIGESPQEAARGSVRNAETWPRPPREAPTS